MKLVPYYENDEDNIGVIESFEDCDPGWIRVSNIGGLHKDCCIDFEPQVGQKVRLWIDGSGRSSYWFLTLEKEKQNV